MEDQCVSPDGDGAYDVVGVGFGPAGIALAVAMEDAEEERRADVPWNAVFVEAAADSAWQPEMLLPGTDIRHHFLRDFATPRNPRSRYTFPNYLKETGRLFSFGLLEGNPGRIEWADYCRWVARQVDQRTRYRHQVTGIEPGEPGADGVVDVLRVHAVDLERRSATSFVTRNVVLCTGRRPYVPELFQPWLGDRVFHSRHFLASLAALPPEAAPTIAVIGSGQNAIEVLLYLIDRYPRSEIVSINRNGGFRLYDLGHFSNRVYSPEEVDYFYWLPKQARQDLLDESRYTNYSSVDYDVSRALYLRMYEDDIMDRNRIRMINRCEVTGVGAAGQRLAIEVEDRYHGVECTVAVDAAVVCTGFVEDRVPCLLDGVRPYLELDEDGDLCVTRDYEVRTSDRMGAGLFVNGLTELTHGMSDSTSFSMMALKADRTLERLGERRARASSLDEIALEGVVS